MLLRLLRGFYKISLCIFLLSFPYMSAAIEKVPPTSKEEKILSFAPLVKQAMPAVVNIYATRQTQTRSAFEGDPFFDDFFFREFFKRPSRKQHSLGSGVIVDPKGLVVTNFHVIRGANEIKLVLADGREFSSEILLKDEKTDLAILQIKKPSSKDLSFPSLPLGDSDSAEVGDLVLAIGNPFGVGQTVTSGIISAQARTHVGISNFDFFIQTDAAINPGNSGGALIDMHGNLLGINTAIYSRSGGSVGIGFAIPANLVKAVLRSVKEGHKNFDIPYIGADFQKVTADISESLGMSRPYGALVTDVIKSGPAEKAGLRVGDVLLSLQGKRIADPNSLGYRLLTSSAGSTMSITYWRDGKEQSSQLTLSSMPKEAPLKSVKISGDNPFSGMTVAEKSSIRDFSLEDSAQVKGVIVVDIDAASVAKSFFLKGDIIQVVNGTKIEKVADLQKALKKKNIRAWDFRYLRNGVTIHQIIR